MPRNPVAESLQRAFKFTPDQLAQGAPAPAPSPWQAMQAEQPQGDDLYNAWQEAQLQGPDAAAAFLQANPAFAAQLQD